MSDEQRPLTDRDKMAISDATKEMADARAELLARIASIKAAREKEKGDWINAAVCSLLPLWAARQVMLKSRGWLCRLFGVAVDHWYFNNLTEIFIVSKRKKIVIIKLYRWDDGQHVEGRR